MNNEKLGQENAFPYEEISHTCGVETRSTYPGMSKRFYAACAAMQGIMSSLSPTQEVTARLTEQISKESYMMADEMLKNEHNDK